MIKAAIQLDAFASPGTLLRLERESQGMTQREAADRLHFMPDYVAILERDDYKSLRSPSFARSYIKAYGRLLGMDLQPLLASHDRLVETTLPPPQKRIENRPVQLQRTGIGVVIGLAVLTLLVAVLWWWEEGRVAPLTSEAGLETQSHSDASLQFAGGSQ